ncbi:hypothetical protein HDU97_002864 [Phlyctochytrium planicorne]|nr:hypothetical protein HDU97_002864 [Phlyctochytrium planicorne]
MERILSRLDQLPGFPVELTEENEKIVKRSRIELEIRFQDWELGALNTLFFAEILGHWEKSMEQIEALYSPPGWRLNFDEDTDSYFFVNSVTNDKTWSWPIEEQEKNDVVEEKEEKITSPANGEPGGEDMELESDKEDTLTDDKDGTPLLTSEEPQKNGVPKEKKTIVLKKPEVVSISAKSKKMANLLVNWRNAKQRLAEEMEEEEQGADDYDVEKGSLRNPNFLPVGQKTPPVKIPSTAMKRPRTEDD